MKPLAYRIRPTSLDDIVGQDHLAGKTGVIRKMLDQKKLFSLTRVCLQYLPII